MSEFAIGKRIEVVDSTDSDLFPNGSVGVIIAKDNYSSEAWWVRFDIGSKAITSYGNERYTFDTGDNNSFGVWSVNDFEMKLEGDIYDNPVGYIETGRKMRKEWEPDQVREDVDLMQSIRDACGG